MFTVLDLFSGIGGFSLGLERTGGFKTVAFCEIDPFCRKVLAKHWPGVPIYEDVQALSLPAGFADVICGGFPCQDISSAGLKVGLIGERSGLWSQYARLIRDIGPRFVIVENVAALLARGIGDVLSDLAALGYDAQWNCIPASHVGAPHGRDRVWIVAYPNDQGQPTRPINDEARRVSETDETVHAQRAWPALALHMARAWREQEPVSWDRFWSGEDPPMGLGMDDGVSERLDRLKSLGNAVVPQIPELIGRAILQAEGLSK